MEDEEIGALLHRPTRRGVQSVPFERAHGDFRAVGLAAQQEVVQHGLAGERNRGGLVKKDVEARPVLLQPAEPMSCLVLSVQPVRMPVRNTTPGSPSRGRWGICSFRALGGLTTRELAERMRAILPGGLNISRWLLFWSWTELNSGYGVIDFGRAPYPDRTALAYRKDTSRAPSRGRDLQAGLPAGKPVRPVVIPGEVVEQRPSMQIDRLPGPPPRCKEGRAAHRDKRYGPGRGSQTGALARLVQLSDFLQLVRDLDERGTKGVFVVVVDEHVLAVGVVAFARAAAK